MGLLDRAAPATLDGVAGRTTHPPALDGEAGWGSPAALDGRITHPVALGAADTFSTYPRPCPASPDMSTPVTASVPYLLWLLQGQMDSILPELLDTPSSPECYQQHDKHPGNPGPVAPDLEGNPPESIITDPQQ